MPAHLHDTQFWPFPLKTKLKVLLGDGYALSNIRTGEDFSGCHEVFDLIKNPWITDRGTTDHDTVYAKGFFILKGFVWRVNVSIAKDGDFDIRVGFDLCDGVPVGNALIHLLAGTAVDGERLDACILQPEGYLYDTDAAIIPAKAGFDSNREGNLLHDLAGHALHFGNVEEDARTSAFAGDFFYRAAVIDIHQFRLSSFGNSRRLTHRLNLVTKDLDADRTLVVIDIEFLHALLRIADEPFGRNKLRVHHVCPHFLAYRTEGRITHILHGSKQQREVPDLQISYSYQACILFCRKFTSIMNNTDHPDDKQPDLHRLQKKPILRPEAFAFTVAASILGFLTLGPLLGLISILPFYNFDIVATSEVLSNLNQHPEARVPMLIFQGVAATVAFILIPWLMLQHFARFDWRSLRERKATVIGIALAVILTIAFMPLNAFFIEWNAHVDMPGFMSGFEQWAQAKEAQMGELSQMMTKVDSFWEYLLAIFVVALLPAIGEEFLFRGIIQRQLGYYLRNPHVAIWLSAIFFSAFHLQFYGFVPRMLLGVLFGYLFYWSGNLRLAMLAHFINNGFTLTLVYIYQLQETDYDPNEVTGVPWPLAVIATLVCLLLGRQFYLHYKKQPLLYGSEMDHGISD